MTEKRGRGRPKGSGKPRAWKVCPAPMGCGKPHNNPGKYCSRRCANRRVISHEQRVAISEANSKQFAQGTASARIRLKNLKKGNKPGNPQAKPVVEDRVYQPPKQESGRYYIANQATEIDDDGTVWQIVGD